MNEQRIQDAEHLLHEIYEYGAYGNVSSNLELLSLVALIPEITIGEAREARLRRGSLSYNPLLGIEDGPDYGYNPLHENQNGHAWEEREDEDELYPRDRRGYQQIVEEDNRSEEYDNYYYEDGGAE